MPIDPQLEPMLEASAALMAVDWSAIDPEMLRQFAAQTIPAMALPEVAAVEDHVVAGRQGPIPARLYRPSDATGLPVILFLHGGGWVMGTIDQYEHFCRELALRSQCAVLSLEYRLAPEHPYPAAIEDSYAGLEWLAANAGRLGLAPDRLAVAGDSAGANLATAVAFLARERGGPALRHQLLAYPVTDRGCDSESHRVNTRYLLTPDMMRWYWRQYVGDRGPADTPWAAPAEFSKLEGMPPATIITAEYDPLRDEGEGYAMALSRAGVPTELVRAPGMIHGFMAMLGLVDAAGLWLEHGARRLRAALVD
ncbi:MAG TPA: alpha/beta hydrolase [Sphingobium sp.]|nr:alpha/beta hydrolase [Sphingobium sp.]